MKQRLKPVVFITLIFLSSSLWAQDLGLLLEQNGNYDVRGDEWAEGKYSYSGILIPRLSVLLGDNGEFFLNAGLRYRINPLAYVPELLRTELIMRIGIGEFKMGRMPYQDPMGIIAAGLFDGMQFSLDSRAGTLSAGCWYTGLLYKERANIAMTDDELQSNYFPVDYNDFMNTYFAPRRILSSLGWEHPALGGLFDIKLALLGQFDMTEADVNTQYFSVKIAIPSRFFIFDVGGCVELFGLPSEYADDFNMALAAETGLTWILPTRLTKHISLRGRFSSGVIKDKPIVAFLPLSTIPQGELLEVKFSGLSIISLNFLARLHRTLSTDLSASCFVRSDLGTYANYPVIGVDSNGYFLGTELSWQFTCSLSSGIQMNPGIGVFLPSLGDAAPKADMLWRAELNLLLSLF